MSWNPFHPKIIEDPGSLEGKSISPIPLRGPDDNILMSLPIFINATANFFNAPDAPTIASFAARDSNLFGAEITIQFCIQG